MNTYIWVLVATNILAIAALLYIRHCSWDKRVERQYKKDFEDDWADGYATLLEKWLNKVVEYIDRGDVDGEPIDLIAVFGDELIKDLYHFMSEYCLCNDKDDFDEVSEIFIPDFQQDLNTLLEQYYERSF